MVEADAIVNVNEALLLRANVFSRNCNELFMYESSYC